MTHVLAARTKQVFITHTVYMAEMSIKLARNMHIIRTIIHKGVEVDPIHLSLVNAVMNALPDSVYQSQTFTTTRGSNASVPLHLFNCRQIGHALHKRTLNSLNKICVPRDRL